jgi:adenine-specific DNA methylase
MNFKAEESAGKLRGGYYTPPSVASFLARWVMARKPRTILEPSVGDGAFLRAFQELHHRIQFTGIELDEEEALKARKAAEGNGFQAEILQGNFLAWALESAERYDAVVGNPPYIRFQYLAEEDRALAERVFERHHLAFTGHANAWVPFVIASVAKLSPGGRLAMVIPSEVLCVLHAAPVRTFLMSECRRVLIIDPRELLFEGTLQGTVLVMAERKSSGEGSEGVSIVPVAGGDFLAKDPEQLFERTTYVSADREKWTKLLLSPVESEVFEEARSSIRRFQDMACVDLGILTGANAFFVVDKATVVRHRLSGFALPVLGRSGNCPGVIYDEALHRENEAKGLRTNLISFGKKAVEHLPKGAREYIALGESQKIHVRQKCRNRTPWYSIPSVYSTTIGMVKCSHDYHRLILNRAGACTTTTAYRVRIVDGAVSPARLVFSFVNSLTALGTELLGRHYGGGVLELVPSEIERLPVPVTGSADCDLEALDAKIKGGTSADIVLREQDEVILKAAGLTMRERTVIHEA